jgi:ubiquinone/menaquinone biosynthesis C-methylase UbiE
MLDGQSSGRAIDLGCGSGAMLAELFKRGYTVYGADISSQMIASSKNLFAKSSKERCPLFVADIEHLPFVDNSFNLIVCAGLIEYLEEDEGALREIVRVLSTDGQAFISVTNIFTPFWILVTVVMLSRVWERLRLVFVSKHYLPSVKSRLHFPRVLRSKLSRLGLRVVDEAYFHFSPLPFPLDRWFASFSTRIGIRMEVLSKTRMGFLGRGYILKVAKRLPR